MHSSGYDGYWFNYNGDYSGPIHITDADNETVFLTFREIVAISFSTTSHPFREAYRGFVAEAAINEGISRLEQMETEAVLENPWLSDILTEMVDGK